jgi:hypothetical protein
MRRLLSLAVIIVISASAREWRSVDGTKSIEAEFGGLKDGRVLLKLPDGLVDPLCCDLAPQLACCCQEWLELSK